MEEVGTNYVGSSFYITISCLYLFLADTRVLFKVFFRYGYVAKIEKKIHII